MILRQENAFEKVFFKTVANLFRSQRVSNVLVMYGSSMCQTMAKYMRVPLYDGPMECVIAYITGNAK